MSRVRVYSVRVAISFIATLTIEATADEDVEALATDRALTEIAELAGAADNPTIEVRDIDLDDPL